MDKKEVLNEIKAISEKLEPQEIAKKAENLGLEYEQKYWGCGQSTLLAILDSFEIKEPEVFRSASGFGAGIGLTNKSTCGALLGAVMAISYVFGRDLSDLESLDRGILCYKISKKMIDAFEMEYGALSCDKIQEELMGRVYSLWDEEEFAQFEEAGGHKDKCPKVVSWCAGKATELILNYVGGRK